MIVRSEASLQQRREWSRKYANRKVAEYCNFLNRIKSTVPCKDCDNTFPPEAMDFDHVNGVKRFDLARGWSHSFQDALLELAKCEVVCSNCHRVRTKARGQHGWRAPLILQLSRVKSKRKI